MRLQYLYSLLYHKQLEYIHIEHFPPSSGSNIRLIVNKRSWNQQYCVCLLLCLLIISLFSLTYLLSRPDERQVTNAINCCYTCIHISVIVHTMYSRKIIPQQIIICRQFYMS